MTFDTSKYTKIKMKYRLCDSAEIDSLRAENERLRALTEWQPIETAPKDGTFIQSYIDGQLEVIHYKYSEIGKYSDWRLAYRSSKKLKPTHWKPISAPQIKGK